MDVKSALGRNQKTQPKSKSSSKFIPPCVLGLCHLSQQVRANLTADSQQGLNEDRQLLEEASTIWGPAASGDKP